MGSTDKFLILYILHKLDILECDIIIVVLIIWASKRGHCIFGRKQGRRRSKKFFLKKNWN